MTSTDEIVENVLQHYGIRGMKWGVRRKNPSGISNLSEDGASARALLSKSASSVSSSDIQTAINRMRLEQQFKDLQAQLTPPSRMDRAKRFVGRLLSDIGANEVNRVAKGATSVAVEKALKNGGKVNLNKEFAEELAKRIAPKKKGK